MMESVLQQAVADGMKKGVIIAKMILQGYENSKIAEEINYPENEIKLVREEIEDMLQEVIEEKIEERLKEIASGAMIRGIEDAYIAKVLNYSESEMKEARELYLMKQKAIEEGNAVGELKWKISGVIMSFNSLLSYIPEEYILKINQQSEETIDEIIEHMKEIKYYSDIDKFLE